MSELEAISVYAFHRNDGTSDLVMVCEVDGCPWMEDAVEAGTWVRLASVVDRARQHLTEAHGDSRVDHYVWTDPRTGDVHHLHTSDVQVVVTVAPA